MIKQKTAYAYIRVDNRGIQDDFCISSQRNKIKHFAEANGFKLVSEHIDLTSTCMPRPGLEALLEDVANHKVDAVVITDISRLARTPSDLRNILNTLRECETELRSCDCSEKDLTLIELYFKEVVYANKRK